MIVVNLMLALPSSSSTITTATATPGETPKTKTKACFILRTASLAQLYEFNLWTSIDYIVNEDTALCLAAFDRGCLENLAALIQSISPAQPASPEWEEDKPESISSSLREVSKIKIIKNNSLSIHHISLLIGSFYRSRISLAFLRRHPTKNNRRSSSSPLHFTCSAC